MPRKGKTGTSMQRHGIRSAKGSKRWPRPDYSQLVRTAVLPSTSLGLGDWVQSGTTVGRIDAIVNKDGVHTLYSVCGKLFYRTQIPYKLIPLEPMCG